MVINCSKRFRRSILTVDGEPKLICIEAVSSRIQSNSLMPNKYLVSLLLNTAAQSGRKQICAWVRWSSDVPSERREAILGYTDGNLTSIKDMLGDTSTLSYNAKLIYTDQLLPSTKLSLPITTSSPGNGGVINVSATDGFFDSGQIKINNDEIVTYSGKTANSFTGITRSAIPQNAYSNATAMPPKFRSNSYVRIGLEKRGNDNVKEKLLHRNK